MIIWGGSSTAVYGYYLWGPTIVALVLSLPVGQAAKYFVYVAGSAVIGKLLVSVMAPVIGRRSLGAVFASWRQSASAPPAITIMRSSPDFR